MAAAIEIARFRVKAGAEEEMVAERPAMVEAVRRHFPAHQDAYLTKLDDGTWMDVVLWSDRDEAEAAAAGFYEHPEILEWFRHIDEVTSFEYAEVGHVAKTSFPGD